MSKNLKSYFAILALAFAYNAQAGVSGFVDAQVATGQNVVGSPDNSPTFRIGDGAVYFTEKAGSSSVMVDIPFMFSGTGSNNTFSIATGKAQAYVTHGYDFGLSWSLGQWDTFYGMEVNDTANNRFAQQGILYAAVPVTHTGFALDYANAGFSAKAFAANTNNQGLRAGDNLDYGGMLKYTHSQFYISGAYKHHKSSTSGESSMLADFQLGTKQGAFNADGEVILTKDAVAGAETGVGFGVWLGYAFSSAHDLAGRFEYTSKVGSNNSQMQWTVGPRHKHGDKFMTRVEYTGTSTTATAGATATTNHGGTLSTVFMF